MRAARPGASVARPMPSTIGETASGNASMANPLVAIAPGSCARSRRSSMRSRSPRSRRRRAYPSQPARGFAPGRAPRTRVIGRCCWRSSKGTGTPRQRADWLPYDAICGVSWATSVQARSEKFEMAFMYCDPPAAIIHAIPGAFSGPSAESRANPITTIAVRLASGVSFLVTSDVRGNGQEWLFSQHLRKADHVKVCFAPPMPPISGHPELAKYNDRYAIVGDVESGYFAYVLTTGKSKPPR